MVINFKDIHFYYLNYEGYTDRRIEMDNMLDSWGVKYSRISNNVDLPLRQNRITIGHIKLLEQAITNNNFPFIITDDDIKPTTKIPENINIPKDTDIIFLGGSLYNCGGIKPDMYITHYDDDFYRTYYMLGLTPSLIPNLKSAQLLLKFLQDSLQTSEFCDIIITMHSKEYIYLTPKNGPYFYQNNYNESVTKFLWKDNLDKYLYPCQQ
jgi:hypothetical protein